MNTFTLVRDEMARLKKEHRAHLTFFATRYWARVLSQVDSRFESLLAYSRPFNISHLKDSLVLDCVAYSINGMKCQRQRAHVVQMGLETTSVPEKRGAVQYYLDLEVLPGDAEE